MQSPYARWGGQPVILQVGAADKRIVFRGRILSETDSAIAFRTDKGRKVNINKSRILAVEERRALSLAA